MKKICFLIVLLRLKTLDNQKIVENITNKDHRPWGYFKVHADEKNYKIKQIVVRPGQCLSLQKHCKRSEHWFIVKGKGIVTLDGKLLNKKEGESIDIPKESIHRIENPGKEDLIFVEIQTGEYFGEDDIERIEDIYSRK